MVKDISPIHPSLFQRRIIHLDMDAFYAAVEVREHPEWRGKPLVVGGQPDGRGVVATCSYEARRFGIHSAMPAAHAYRLCPHAIFVKPRFQEYKKVSLQVREILSRYCHMIEPLSLDEAYLDVTDEVEALGTTASRIAANIRATIYQELGLSSSAGVAPNKMLAKIASDCRKPNGQTVIPPHEVGLFMQGLPVARIPGIGPVTTSKLAQVGIHTCADVLARQEEFSNHEGRFERWLWRRVQGIDERPVETVWERKSIGHEETFSQDIQSREILNERLDCIALQLQDRLARSRVAGRTVTLKIKYRDFELITRSRTLPEYISDHSSLSSIGKWLMEKSEAGNRAVRLLGLTLSNLRSTQGQSFQPLLFG